MFPLFEKGRILKKEVLDSLRDYPRDMTALLLSSYSDGIIAGFGIHYNNGNIVVDQGLLKHGQVLYLLSRELLLPSSLLGRNAFVRLSVGETRQTADYLVETFQIRIEESSRQKYGDYTLGTFCLEEGAVLRTSEEYRNFEDAGTMVNTLNLIDTPYAGRGQATMAPLLLQYYAKEVIKSSSRTSLDEAFCLLCLNSQLMEKDTIRHYLVAQGCCLPASPDNRELYHQLLAIWKRRCKDRGIDGETGQKPSRRTMIE